MEEEITSINKNDTWELVEFPKVKNILLGRNGSIRLNILLMVVWKDTRKVLWPRDSPKYIT